MKKSLIAALWIVFGLQVAVAQRLLVVRQAYSRLSYQYKEGESVKIQLEQGRKVLRGNWQYAGENAISLSGRTVALNAIRWIDVTGKEKGVWILRKGRDLLTLAGTGYYAAWGLNHLLEDIDSGGGHPVLRTSAGLVAGGILCGVLDRVVRKRKITARHGLRMRMVELPDDSVSQPGKNP